MKQIDVPPYRTLADAKVRAKAAISNAARKAEAKYETKGKESQYREKLGNAYAYLDNPLIKASEIPFLKGYAEAVGISMAIAVQNILTAHETAIIKIAAISKVEDTAKAAINAVSDGATAQRQVIEIRNSFIVQLGKI